jgi:hypothetical protein
MTGSPVLTGYVSTNYKFPNLNRQMPQSPNLQQSSDQAIANSAMHDLHIGRSFLKRRSSVERMLPMRGKTNETDADCLVDVCAGVRACVGAV